MEGMEPAKAERSTARRLFSTSATKLKLHIVEKARASVEAEFNKLNDRYARLQDANNKVLSIWYDMTERDEEAFQADIDSMEPYDDTWYSLKQAVTEYLESTITSTKKPSHSTASSSSHQRTRFHLPKLQLPKFGGEIRQWLGFWAQFKKIDTDEHIDEDEKFHYLLQCMEPGSSARELVESFPPTGENYQAALKQLKERFAREEAIIEHYVRELLQLVLAQTKASSKTTIRALYDKLMTQILALESLGVTQDKYASFLFPLVESALPEDVLKAWSRSHLSANTGGTPLTKLLDFVKKEVEAEERIRMSRSSYEASSASGPTAAFASTSYKNPDNRGPQHQNINNKEQPMCLWCDKTSHPSSECSIAMKKSLAERRAIIKTKKACSICLKKGHWWKKCSKHPVCILCGKRHFTIMCNKLQEKPNASNENDSHASTTENNESVLNQLSSKIVLMQTLQVRLVNAKKSIQVRVLMDSGAQHSFIKTGVAEKLGLKPVETKELSHVLFGGKVTKKRTHQLYEFEIQSLDGTYTRKIKALEQEKICGCVPKINKKGSIVSRLRSLGVTLADCDSDLTEISVLIGSDVLGSLFTGESARVDEDLMAIKTKLGWTVQGPALGVYCSSVGNVKTVVVNNACSFDIEEFWKLETIGIRDDSEVKTQQKLNSEVALFFKDTVRVNEEERYEVQLPWKDTKSLLQSNYGLALKRLNSTTAKLVKLGILDDYNQVFEEWRESNIIEEVGDDDHNTGHYLPHHAVVKESSLTTKIRPVFDASALDKNGLSLNSCLEKGINLIELIPKLLLQFRRNAIGVTADIKKAFLQISVHPQDRNYLKFLWWRDINAEERILKAFRHRRVVFGVTTSPFLLSATILYHLEQFQGDTAKKLRSSYYVDNCVLSVKNEHEMDRFVKEAKEIMLKGKFELRSWVTGPVITDKEITSLSVLGLMWDPQCDELFCKVPSLEKSFQDKVTKRSILSAAQSIFDPIGFACPATIIPKLVIQKCWMLNLDWDQEVPKELDKVIRDWTRHLECLKLCRIPRRLSTEDLDSCKNSLHIFADASQVAYAACVFLRSESDNKVDIQLVIAKSRVAPTKSVTTPRLELTAALMATRLAIEAKNGLEVSCKEVYWTDSSIVLAWLRRKVGLNVFVNNRVSEIIAKTNVEDWRHIPGELNPADLPSRGCNAENLLKSTWWEGPMWLKDSPNKWPKSISSPNEEEVLKEVKKSCLLVQQNERFSERLCYFSKFSMIVRVVAWLFRFVNNCKSKLRRTETFICNDELIRAENCIFKLLQLEHFDSSENLSSKFNLDTFVDENELIRVKTRLSMGNDTYDFKCPILLSSKSVIIERLVAQEHVRCLHAGSQTLISKLRERFWILGIRRLAKTIVHNCVICRRHSAKPCSTPNAPLPVDRIHCGSVFEVTGIDLAGPLQLKSGSKCWVVLFTCATYRAVHLEICTSLSTEHFLMALRRFLARRGCVRVIYSDNGTNLRGASYLFKNVNWKEVECHTSMHNILWRHIPPAAPWWGGFWERLIKVVKDILKRVLGKAALQLNELETVLCEVESIVNARPLTYISSNTESLTTLTPSMFINVGAFHCDTGEVFNQLNGAVLSARWRYVINLQNALKQRFHSEYLSLLAAKKSKRGANNILNIGDIVIIGSDDVKHRISWPLGVITEIFQGRDGHPRVVRVKTEKGFVDRPYERVYPLEVPKEQCTGSLDGP